MEAWTQSRLLGIAWLKQRLGVGTTYVPQLPSAAMLLALAFRSCGLLIIGSCLLGSVVLLASATAE